MAIDPNEYHIVAFDPGGITGWAHLILDARAFSRPEHKALKYLKHWTCGEFEGPENQQVTACAALIWKAKFGEMPHNTTTDAISKGGKADFLAEDFELTQMIGGKNLLSPVRINAKLDYICYTFGIELHYQRRTMRTGVTPERLQLFGFNPPGKRWTTTGKGKDAFAAMQHAVVWLRRTKEKSRGRPWKLSDGGTHNAYWDCACDDGERCDLRHT